MTYNVSSGTLSLYTTTTNCRHVTVSVRMQNSSDHIDPTKYSAVKIVSLRHKLPLNVCIIVACHQPLRSVVVNNSHSNLPLQ